MTEAQTKHLITKETAAQLGSRGGKARAAKAAKAKTFKEAAKALLTDKNKDGETAIIKIVAAMIERAKQGDVKAAEFLRQAIGEAETLKAEIKNNIGIMPEKTYIVIRSAADMQRELELKSEQGGNA